MERRLSYCVRLISLLFVFNLALNLPLFIHLRFPAPSLTTSNLNAKERFFKRYFRDFDLVFIGDSRTYCGFQPHLIDPILKTRSANLARFAHWFPTQYAQVKSLLPYLGKPTTVIWSLGHQNFQNVNDKKEIYPHIPIGYQLVPRYLRWGYTLAELQDNLLSYTWGFQIFTMREHLANFLKGVLSRRGFGQNEISTLSVDEKARAALKICRENPATFSAEYRIEGEKITSIEMITRGGSYERMELLPAFFRQKQAESKALIVPASTPAFLAERKYWETFTGMLDLFQGAQVRLIVNEFQEAPYHYEIPENKERFEAFMRKVQMEVEARGIPYVRVDFAQLSDADYFDNNHLNVDGCVRFTKLFCDAIRERKLIP